MARIKIKNKSIGKKPEPTTTTNEKQKEGGKIYKFSPQVVGQKMNTPHSPPSKKKLFGERKWNSRRDMM